jgi:pSer/pThr/pTyr-binding forkhead associated (FHA) protein
MSNSIPYDGPVLMIEIQGHSPYYLRPGSSLSVGRRPTNDIVITDSTVSRHHAAIKWDKNLPIILDQNSTCGISIDGDYSSFGHLSNIHQVKLGSARLRMELIKSERECPTEVDILNLRSKNAILSEFDNADDVALFREFGSEDVSGYVCSNKEVRRLLIHLDMTRRTGTLTLTEGSTTATIIYGLGKIMEAACGDKSGQRALRHICEFSGDFYHFTIKVDVGEYSMDVSPMCYIRALAKCATDRTPRPGCKTL